MQMKFQNPRKIYLMFAAAFLLLAFPAHAAETSYDRYASMPRVSEPRSSASRVSTDFLSYPFELLRWPISKSLYLTEKYHLDNKAKWAYDTLADNGITPKLGLFSLTGGSGGVTIDYVRLFRQKNDFPDLVAKSWVDYSNNVRLNLGSELGWQDLGGSGVGASTFIDYDSRPEEHFYGIGPETSAGNGTSYKMETTTLGAKLTYDPRPTMGGNLFFNYKNVNITNGEDGGRGIIDDIFPRDSIPGLAGDELLVYGAEVRHDTRNQRELSTAGGLRRVGLALNDGVGSSEARFIKYEAEFSQYFALGSPRRVLAYHAFAEHNDELGNSGTVPFHQMAKLGGYGIGPWLSRTLRGYDQNRFTDESSFLMNLEYRYTVWESRNFRMDTVAFTDLGQVFGELNEFEFDNFRESYGGGFRFSVANHMLLGVEVAHGDEGTNLYVRSSTPF